jgi:hypothetical protein
LFNERFAARVQHSPAETTPETGDACEADYCDFDDFAVKHVDACLIKKLI